MSLWVYGYDMAGEKIGRAEQVQHLPAHGNRATRYMLLKRKQHWHVFEFDQPIYSPIPEKVIARLWRAGQGDLRFPTKHAAETFMLLRGRL